MELLINIQLGCVIVFAGCLLLAYVDYEVIVVESKITRIGEKVVAAGVFCVALFCFLAIVRIWI